MEIKPLRGYRYTGDTTRDISTVVAPPYDQISPETQDRLYTLNLHNIVRVTYPKDAPGKYGQAREVLDAWLAEGVWRRDERAAIYPYDQSYTDAGQSVTRTGFVALGEVSDYGRGVVLPHERTHAGPKRDRMDLLEATAADIGLLFMLASDPDGELRRATAPAGEPIAEARDLKGERHRLWRVTDPTAIARVQALMAPRQVIIADGHHRYETAVAYAGHHPEAAHKLMAFFALEAPGLTILPNHRLVHSVQGFDFDDLMHVATRWFDVTPLADPLVAPLENRTIGVVSGSDAALLRLKPAEFDRIAWPERTSRAWRELAVSILHEGLLRPLLGITDAKLAPKTHVELPAVVRGGELLPQQSTHFYPTLLDGLVFHRLGE